MALSACFARDTKFIENSLGEDDFVGEPNRSAFQLRFTASPRETLPPRSLAKNYAALHNRLSPCQSS